jgi:guanylate kinase
MSVVYIISAPSGSGKSTLVNELRKIVHNLDFSISYTTRKPRGSEQNGREYNFVTREKFDEMIAQGEFLEHAEVFGHCYGTVKKFLADAQSVKHDLVLDIDVQGAAQIKHKLPQAVSIFILPPDRRTLEWRLRSRGQDDNADIDRRLATAKREIENYDKYDYILVNDRLEESVDKLKAVVLAERLRRSGVTPSAEDSHNMSSAERCRLENMREQVRRILRSFDDGTSETASGV